MTSAITRQMSDAPSEEIETVWQTSLARQVSVREGYKLWAATYDEDPNPLLALEERSLEPLLPDLRSKDVLDLGCGTGRWLRRLISRGAGSVLGVDFSPEMMRRSAASPLLRGHLVLADCSLLPLRTGVADVIVCSFVAAHLADLGTFAREASRVARPGAQLFLTDLHPEARRRGWLSAFRHPSGRVEVRGCCHTRQDTEGWFESEGFRPSGYSDLRLDEPERTIFARAGKSAAFETVCLVPAVALYHFTRSGNRES